MCFAVVYFSGLSGNSFLSQDSVHSDVDELHASTLSLSNIHDVNTRTPSPANSFDAQFINSSGLRHRSRDSSSSELKPEFYSWWDNELEK